MTPAEADVRLDRPRDPDRADWRIAPLTPDAGDQPIAFPVRDCGLVGLLKPAVVEKSSRAALRSELVRVSGRDRDAFDSKHAISAVEVTARVPPLVASAARIGRAIRIGDGRTVGHGERVLWRAR